MNFNFLHSDYKSLKLRKLILFFAIFGSWSLSWSSEKGFIDAQIQCENIFLLKMGILDSTFNSSFIAIKDLNTKIENLARLELSFATDLEFQKNPSYRSQLLDKFKEEYNKLIAIGGEAAQTQYFSQREQLRKDSESAHRKNKQGAPKIKKTIAFPKLVKEIPLEILSDTMNWFRSVVTSPDGNYFFIGEQQKVLIFDIRTRQVSKEVPIGSRVHNLVVTPDGNYLIVAGEFGHLKVIDVATGAIIREIPTKGYVQSLTLSKSGKYIITGGYLNDRSLRVIDFVSGEIKVTIPHDASITSVAMSSDEKYIFSASSDGEASVLRQIHFATGEVMETLLNDKFSIPLKKRIVNLKVSGDGRLLFMGTSDENLHVIDIATHMELYKIPHGGDVNSIAVYPSEYYLITGASRSRRVLDYMSGQIIHELNDTDGVLALDVSADGHFLCTVSYNQIKIYSL